MEHNATQIRTFRIPRARRQAATFARNPAANRKPRERQPGIPERFPLTLDVRYTLNCGAAPTTGSGRTIEIGSSELRFTADRPLAMGLPLHLAVDWPVALDGGVQLQLIATGEVVWSRGTETALKIYRHEIRTRRTGLTLAVSKPSFR
jgi:hypothetical protein